jgi:hypothetical protein
MSFSEIYFGNGANPIVLMMGSCFTSEEIRILYIDKLVVSQ